MGAGASSGAGQAGAHGAPKRGALAGGPATTANRIMGMNGQPAMNAELSRASVASVDQPSPKHGPKHVVIQVADPKNYVYKGQKGGLLEKLKHVASQHNSPTHSAAGSRAGSHAGSQAGSVKSHASRRDAFDVESDDEDLEGFIYDDESTSEDEREDYVNAFSRRRKVHKADDYSEYEGANVRAMTAGGHQVPKSAAMRRAAHKEPSDDEDDDGDDEFDPEEEKIRILRQQKRQQEKLKAAAFAAHATVALAAEPGRSRGAGAGGPGPSAGAAGAGAGPSGAAPPHPALHHSHPPHHDAHVRIVPTPPPEPPARGSSGNIRRSSAAGAAASSSYGGGGSGGASGPGPGPGSGPAQGPGPAGGAGRGAGGRPSVVAPAPAVNYGSSASSQYWQARRNQDEDEDGEEKPAMSRLEQLQALQRKRQAEQERQRGGEEGEAGEGGVRWQLPGNASSPKPFQQQPEPPQVRNGEARPAHQADALREEPAAPVHRTVMHKTSSVKQFPVTEGDRDEEERAKYFRTNTSVASQAPTGAAGEGAELLPQQQRPSGTLAQRRDSQGQRTIVIKHLEPPLRPPVPFAPSPRPSSGAAGLVPQPPLPHQPPQPKDSDDFDVDEMLSSFAPRPPAQPQQQWAGGRPQPPTTPPPPKDPGQRDPPQHKRSIRAVHSDFTGMRTSETGDSSGEVAGRILSLPVAASRPDPNSPVGVAPSGQSVPSGVGGAAAPGGVSSAPAAVSRFARQGPTSTAAGPATGPAANAAWTASNVGYSQRAASPLPAHVSAAPSPFRAGSPTNSPLRLPRPSAPSSDGSGPLSFQTSLSAPPGEIGAGGGGSGGGVSPLVRRNSQLPAGRSPRASSGDGVLLLPAIRPGSSSSGANSGGGARGSDAGSGGSILSGAAAGRSRFGAVQHQAMQQEALRSSAPLLPSQLTARDYDSDSALTSRNSGPAGRVSGMYGGTGAGGPGGGMRGVAGSGNGMLAVGAGAGPAALRSRLGQVGA